MTHNVTKLLQVKDNKSHVKHILLYMCQICLTIFLTHGVPNTPQVKQTEYNCEAYFTQHVSNVTLCRGQIYSVLTFYIYLPINCKLIQKFKDCYCSYRYYTVLYSIVPGFSWILCHFVQLFKIGHYVSFAIAI
jgi:hypothetical protein